MSRLLMISVNDRGNLGARQLVAEAKLAGHEACLLNWGEYRHATYEFSEEHDSPHWHDSLDRYEELLTELRPDVVGISYRSSMFVPANVLGGLAMTAAPKARIIAGGIGATSDPKGALRWADAVCVGEGDQAVAGILAAPRLRRRYEGALTRDLDILPFPDYDPDTTWSIVEGRVIHPDGRLDNDIGAYPLLTSRGCPRACSYCHNSTIHALYKGQPYCRQRGVDHVMSEIRWARQRWPLKMLSIYDDLFTANAEWVLEFCGRLRTAWHCEGAIGDIGRPPRFWCMAHPSYIRRDVIAALVGAGMEEICLGVQSGSQRILDLYRRGTTPEDILRAAGILAEFPSLAVKVDIITANPLETPADVRATMDLVQRMPRNPRWKHGLSRLQVFPGSGLAVDHGLTQADCDALHTDRQEFADGLFRGAFQPRWYGWDLCAALDRYDAFCRFRASRDWPADKGQLSDEHWMPLTRWLDEGMP